MMTCEHIAIFNVYLMFNKYNTVSHQHVFIQKNNGESYYRKHNTTKHLTKLVLKLIQTLKV